jgi:arsenate reductase
VHADTQPAVQIFGRRDSRETQKAIRYFRERQISASFVDVAAKSPARGELRRFADRVGPSALLDTEGRRYRDLGLAYMRMDADELFERLLADPRLLRLPLVRMGSNVAVGADEAAWKAWLRPGAPSSAADRER